MATSCLSIATVAEDSTLRARRLVLEDGEGRPTVLLGPAIDGEGLVLLDAQERPRAQLILDSTGAVQLKLHDSLGEVCAWLAVGAAGIPSLWLRAVGENGRGLGHAGVQVDALGCASLSLHDSTGRARAILRVDEHDGRSTLALTDTRGAVRTVLSDEERHPASLVDFAAAPFSVAESQGAPRRPDPPPATVSLPPPGVQTVAPRLRLQDVRPIALGGIMLACAAIGAWAAGRAPWSTPSGPSFAEVVPRVDTREVVLRDAAGSVRARLGTLEDGAPYVYLVSPDGTGEIELSASPGPSVQLRLASGGGDAVVLATAPRGGPSLGLWHGDTPVLLAPGNVARFPSSRTPE